MLNIKVLGSGCANCKKLEALVHEAVDSLGVTADIEKVTDMAAISSYAIMSTPGLVMNEKVVSAGRIPQKSEIEKWIKEAA